MDINDYFDKCFKAIEGNKICKTKNINKCESCNNTNIIKDYAQGNYVCANCGQVKDLIIDDIENKEYCDKSRNAEAQYHYMMSEEIRPGLRVYMNNIFDKIFIYC